MTIEWITIKTADFEKSKKFYRDYLGMKEAESFSPNEFMDITFFEADNKMKIELIYDKRLSIKKREDDFISIGFRTSGYEKLLRETKNKEMIISGPVTLGGHMECFFVKDPNGVGFQIIKG